MGRRSGHGTTAAVASDGNSGVAVMRSIYPPPGFVREFEEATGVRTRAALPGVEYDINDTPF